MRSHNGQMTLAVKEVLSGTDHLGSGQFKATLKNGRFLLDPFQLDIPGGSVNLAFAFEPTETEVALETSAKIDQFDYGVLARRVKPESKMGGMLTLDVNVKARAKSIDTIMQHADGYIDFAIVPKDFEADVFELWAVNLLAAVLPRLDSEKSSVVNCGVFRFDLKDGIMKEDAILVDTTKMQVRGKADVDFKTKKVRLILAPKAKRPEFFSLATPIRAEGSFSDFGIGINPGGLIGTTIRFTTSPVFVPLQRLFLENEPADGETACAAAMHRPHDK
jgi:uncharacterized protein involved in outer membrane biogenesis